MVPFIGRLSLTEWIVLFLVYTERICSFFINNLIPSPLIRLLQAIADSLMNVISLFIPRSSIGKTRVESEKDKLVDLLKHSASIKETIHYLNPDISIEEHIVVTDDKYLLTLHRIPPDPTRECKGVVYLHHGLLMCSDIWICHHIDPMTKNLPLLLHSLKNYDVWMGNNRGNKYSTYNLNYTINDNKFWDFSLDEFALFDIPNSIDYILKITKKSKISSIIAFSQGSAQTFGALSLHPELNEKVENFIALAPAMTPPGLYNKIVDTLMKTSPQLIYLFFGKRILLSSANRIWKKTLPTRLFNMGIEMSTKFLFNWNNFNIKQARTIAFNNLYSPTSVKCVVHWFQILNAQKFKMFQEISFLDSTSGTNQQTSLFHPLCFPTLTNVKIPVLLIYGGSDSLVDIEVMKKNLPKDLCFQVEIPNHEHLDIIWGDHCHTKVWPHVLKFMQFWNEDFKNSYENEVLVEEEELERQNPKKHLLSHEPHLQRKMKESLNDRRYSSPVVEQTVRQNSDYFIPFDHETEDVNKYFAREDVTSTLVSTTEYVDLRQHLSDRTLD